MEFTSLPGARSRDDACPKCGGELRFLEKDTSSGREYREYRCKQCGEYVTLGGNVALWQMLHDSNQERADTDQAEAPKRPWWKFWNK